MRRSLRGGLLLGGLALLLLAVPASRAAAHNAYPAHEYNLALGPYGYHVLLFNEKVNAGDRVQLVLVPDAATRDVPLDLRVQAAGPDGSTVAAFVRPDENDPRNPAADVTIPAPGAWRIRVTARGPRGGGSAEIAVSVAPAPAIPLWAGWAVALSPLLGVAWLAVQQRALLRRAAAEGIRV